jgi:hypothetical protein
VVDAVNALVNRLVEPDGGDDRRVRCFEKNNTNATKLFGWDKETEGPNEDQWN